MRSAVLISAATCLLFQFFTHITAQITVFTTVTETQIGLFWTVDPQKPTLYNVTINPSANKNDVFVQMIASSLGQSNLTFQTPVGSLRPGVLYDIKLIQGNTGEVLYNGTHATKPLPPMNVTVTQRGTTYLEISWTTHPASTQDRFMVVFSNASNIGGVEFKHVDTDGNSFNLTDLSPGRDYNIDLIAFSNDEASNTTAPLTENTAPLPPINVEITALDTKRLNISADADPNGEQTGFAYAYKLDGGSQEYYAQCIGSSEYGCVFIPSGLPGQKYMVAAVSTKNATFSSAVIVYHNTIPLPVNRIDFTESSASSLKVSWSEPEGSKQTGFRVEVYDKSDRVSSSNVTLPQTIYLARNLNAGKAYNVSVTVLTDTEESTPFMNTSYTNPNPPIFSKIIPTTDSLTITWNAPTGGVEEYALGIQHPSNGSVKEERITTDMSATFGDLTAGTSYIILALSLIDGRKSVVVNTNATTRPDQVTSMSKIVSGTDFINVTWEEPTGDFDDIKLTIQPKPLDSSPDVVTFSRSSGVLEYGFSSLHAGFMYRFTIVTVKNGIDSPPFLKQFLTYPLPVTDLTVNGISTTSLEAAWNVHISSDVDYFHVVCSPVNNSFDISNTTVNTGPNKISYTTVIDSLYPGQSYTVSVVAIRTIGTDTTLSESKTANGTVYPKPVDNLRLTPVGKYGFTVKWDKQNGSIEDQFLLEYRPVLRNSSSLWIQNFTSTDERFITVNDLFPGEQYEISVYAVSNGQKSSNVTASRILEPLPPASVKINHSKVTTDSVALVWDYAAAITNVDKWRILYKKVGETLDKEKFVYNTGVAEVEVDIDGLSAGEHYEVAVFSKVLDVSSDTSTDIAITAKPTIETNMYEDSEQTTTDTVALTYDRAYNKFDYFKFYALEEPEKIVTKTKDDTDRRVLINGLTGGVLYNVEVVAVSGEEKSAARRIEILTVPNNPIVEIKAKTRSILMNVTQPSGKIDYVTITCVNSKTGEVAANVTHTMSDTKPLVFPDLRPYTRYTITFKSYRLHKENTLVVEKRTLEDAPTEVLNVKSVETMPITASLSWDEPEELNGELLVYNVKYTGIYPDKQHDIGEVNVTQGRTVDITNLKAGFNYTFMVRAITVAVGKPGYTSITMRTYPPAFKEEISSSNRTPAALTASGKPKVTPSSISVMLRNVFSNKYGDIITYTVIVSTEKNTNHLLATVLPGWKNAQNDPAVKAYQVIQNCSQLFSSDSNCDGSKKMAKRSLMDEKEFDIGVATDCKNDMYCNGPLKPNTDYYVVLRAYSAGGFKDTPFSKKISTAPEPDETSSAGIIGGVIGALLFVLIIVAIVIFILRRRRHGSRKQMYRSDPTENQMTPRSSTRKVKTSRRIKLSDFKEHVKLMSADSDFRYADEFEDLKKVGKENTCHAAEMPVNRGKNRFTNVLPYDHSRVKLLQTDDEEGTDYINANYIAGHNSKREYIVTQGPLHSTRDDFWRMIWEQNCQNVVMLTRCKEKGRVGFDTVSSARKISIVHENEKCDRYWPEDSEALFYGDLQVAILNETRFPEWCITEFRVSLGNKTRQIRHFHYTAWPDFGVPERPQSLIRFVRTVRSKLMKESGPIIVHCSAGVGRSGTFISLDRLLQHIIEHDYVDIYGIVHEMRKDRMSMVQLEQQYICIHQCLLCVLEGREDEDPVYHNIGIENRAFEDDEGINVEI